MLSTRFFLLDALALLYVTGPALSAHTAKKLFKSSRCQYLAGGTIHDKLDQAFTVLGKVEQLVADLSSATKLDSPELRNAQQISHNAWGLLPLSVYDDG